MKQLFFKSLLLVFSLLINMSAFAQTEVTIGQLKYQLNGTEAYVSGYVGEPTDVVIPATIESDGLKFKVTQIKGGAFRDCTTITSVKAEGNNLSIIGYSGNSYGAFQGCSSLVSVYFPYAKIIYRGSFRNCSKLQYVWFGYNLTELDGSSSSYDGVFYNCTMLSYIVIPAPCTRIGYNNQYTFYGCSRLQAIIYLGNQTAKGGSNADVYNVNNMLDWSNSSFTYSGKAPSPTFTSSLPAGFQPTSNAAQGNLEKNAGTYETTVPVTFKNSEMEFTANIPYKYTITPATLTARVKNATKVYGEPNPQFQSEYSGFVNGENSSAINNHGTYSTSANTKSSVGSYSVTQSGASATNYVFNYESGVLTVTKAALTMSVRDKKIVYGDPIPGFDVDYYGLVNSEAKPEWTTAPNVTTEATSKSDAGTYPITISGGVAKNYDVKFVNGTLTINKALLTATTKDATRIYGDRNPDFELKYEGLKNNETAPAWAKAPTFATPATETSPVGKYDITATGGEAKNYLLQFANTGKLSVTKAMLTAKARSYTKKQYDNNPKFAIDYEGFKNNETKIALTEEPIATTTATLNSKPGTYPITLSGGIAMNYEFTYVNGTLTIIPRDDEGDPTANILMIDNLVGNKGSQCVLPIALKNEKVITGVQCDLYLPQGVTVATDSKGKMLISTTNRMTGNYSVTSNQMNSFVRILGYSANGDFFTGNSGDILNITLNIGSSVANGDYDIVLKDIVLSDVNNQEYHPADVDATLTVKNYKVGDVDNSGAININDVVCIINYILGKQVGTFIPEAADVDGSGKVNINDVVTLINRYILNRTSARATVNAVTRGVSDNNYLHLDQIDIKPGETKEIELLLTNTGTVAAAQGNIKLPEGLSFVTKSNGRVDASNVNTRAEGYTLSCALQNDGSLTFAHYSPDGYTYEEKSGGIFTFKIKAADDAKPGSYEVKLSDVVLSVDGVGVDIPDRTSVLNIIGETGGDPDSGVVDGIYYKFIQKINCAEVISNPNKYTGSVVIPESVKYGGKTYSVTHIGYQAFYECYGLTSVTIPNSVTEIGSYAFQGCNGLTSVYISDLDAWCNITFGSNPLGYAHHLYLNGEEVKELVISNNVTSINGAFSGCSGLTSVTIPNSVTSIGSSAFYGCSGLTSVNIPNSVTSIGDHAFGYCSGLTSVIIPNSVTSVGNSTFYSCTGLTSVTIPNSVTSIGSEAFRFCRGLTSVTIPNSVTSIYERTFGECSGLTSVIIPNSVTSIGRQAFYSCSSLASVIIPNSVTSIGKSAFWDCSGLTSVTIGSDVKIIENGAFASCKELTNVYCLANNIPSTGTAVFGESYIEYATLHVPSNAVNAYKATEPWKNFKKIVSLDESTQESKKCVKPIISYQNGELRFNSNTEGAEYVYEITDYDIKEGYASKVKLSATYNISVYATKTGYENSDIATATLCWIDVDPKTEGITNNMAQVRAKAVLIQSNGNVLTISGADEGEEISVYDTAGKKVGSAKANIDTTSVHTSLQSGSIAIVKIGQKTVKVMMK